MKLRAKILLLLMMLLPVMFAFLLAAGTAPVELTRFLREERAALNVGDAEDERYALEGVLEFQLWRGDLWQRLGRLYMDSGDTQRALKAFEKSQELDQLDAQGQVWLGDMLITSGYGDAARHVLGTVDSGDAFILLQAAALMGSLGDHEGTLDLLEKARAAEPRNSEVNYQLGINQMTDEPGNALAHLELARAEPSRAVSAGYLIKVIQQYGEVSGSSDWFLYAGQALAQAGEWNAALYSFNLAVKAQPENSTAWALLGETQQQLGLDGWQSLETALRLDAENEMPNGMLGLYYRREGSLEKALQYLRIAHLANPEAGVWLIESGRTLAAMGRLEEGEQEFRRAIEIDKNNIDSWQALAEFSILHNYQVANTGLEAARAALALEPENPVMLDLLGTAYLMLGDLDSAERFFLQALQRDPEQAAILIHLGQLNLYRDEKEAAFDYLRRAVTAARDDRLRDMANRLLKENGVR